MILWVNETIIISFMQVQLSLIIRCYFWKSNLWLTVRASWPIPQIFIHFEARSGFFSTGWLRSTSVVFLLSPEDMSGDVCFANNQWQSPALFCVLIVLKAIVWRWGNPAAKRNPKRSVLQDCLSAPQNKPNQPLRRLEIPPGTLCGRRTLNNKPEDHDSQLQDCCRHDKRALQNNGKFY